MDSHSQEQQISDVPPSQPEHDELQAGRLSGEFTGESDETKAVEQAASTGQDPKGQDDTGLAVPISSQPQQPADPAASAQAGSLPQGWLPQIADDTDLIEKEWVDKAKEIVAQTAHDPFLQNKEINKVRADYLKKRYNKDLKQGE